MSLSRVDDFALERDVFAIIHAILAEDHPDQRKKSSSRL